MARTRKAPTKQAFVPKFAHDELKDFLDKLNSAREARGQTKGPKVTAPDMLGALMLAVQRLPLEVADALIPAYQEREREELDRAEDADQAEGSAGV
jgi:hypothetical protein